MQECFHGAKTSAVEVAASFGEQKPTKSELGSWVKHTTCNVHRKDDTRVGTGLSI
jgi:hypothetical protein